MGSRDLTKVEGAFQNVHYFGEGTILRVFLDSLAQPLTIIMNQD
jgi:hypothetical protein